MRGQSLVILCIKLTLLLALGHACYVLFSLHQPQSWKHTFSMLCFRYPQKNSRWENKIKILQEYSPECAVYTYTINIVYKHTYRYLQTHTHITASKLWSCAVQWSLLEMPWDQHLEDWVTCLGTSHRCRKLYLGTLFLNSSHIYKSIQLLELWSSETARQKGKYGSAHYTKCVQFYAGISGISAGIFYWGSAQVWECNLQEE